jgi:O-antigen ligase
VAAPLSPVGPLADAIAAFLVLQMLPLPEFVASHPFVTAAGKIIASTTLSISPGDTALMLLRLSGYWLFFTMVLRVSADAGRANRMLLALFAIIAAYALLGLALLTQFGDTLLWVSKWAYQGDATATFINKNSFATFLAFGVVIGLVLFVNNRAVLGDDVDEPGEPGSWGVGAILICGLLFVGAALLATHSRMGVLAAITGCMLALPLSLSKLGLRRTNMIVSGFAVILAVLLLAILFGGGVVERLTSIENATDVRIALYRQVLRMIADRPWLGYGGGTFQQAYPLYHLPPVGSDAVVDRAHSTYLTLWVELGLAFGSVPMAMVAGAGVACLRLFRISDTNWATPLAAAAVIVVAAVHSTVEFSLEIEANVYLFLAVLAIGLGRLGRRSSSTTANPGVGTEVNTSRRHRSSSAHNQR